MKEIKLPEPFADYELWGQNVPVYTADQMKAAILEERQRCAKICDAAQHELWEVYKGRSNADLMGRGRGTDYVQGAADQAGLLSSAIRSQ